MPVWFVFHFMEGDGEKGKGEEEIIDEQIHTGQLGVLCNIPEFSCCAEPFYSGKIPGKEWDNRGEVILNVFFYFASLTFQILKKSVTSFNKGIELHLGV